MYIVIIPLVFLICVSIFKKIPIIGGNLPIAFLGAGLLALLLGGAYRPIEWIEPWLTSFDSIAYIAFVVLFGSFFSLLQVETGAMETVLNILRAIFGKTPQGLILATLIALYFGGAVMGTVAAVGAVIGVLIVPALDEMKIKPELVCAIIVTGASMGGIMPPVSNAIILACGLMEIDSAAAIAISYVTVGIGLILIAFFFCKVYIGNKYQIPQNLIPKEKAHVIFLKNWKKLLPLFVLIVLITLNSVPGITLDIPKQLMQVIKLGDSNLYEQLSGIKIIGKITNNIVMSMVWAILACFIFDFSLFKKLKGKTKNHLKNIVNPEVVLIVTAFFLGAFKLGGQNQAITDWAGNLNGSLLIVGGALAMVVAGMLSGAQSTAQSMLTPILAPAWMAIGLTPLHIALASSHLAMAGQGLPPADMNTFIIAGLVSALLGKKVNPMKSMLYSAPYCIYLILVGMIFLFI